MIGNKSCKSIQSTRDKKHLHYWQKSWVTNRVYEATELTMTTLWTEVFSAICFECSWPLWESCKYDSGLRYMRGHSSMVSDKRLALGNRFWRIGFIPTVQKIHWKARSIHITLQIHCIQLFIEACLEGMSFLLEHPSDFPCVPWWDCSGHQLWIPVPFCVLMILLWRFFPAQQISGVTASPSQASFVNWYQQDCF